MVADVRSFGFRMGSECPGSVCGHAHSAVGATSRPCCQPEPAGCLEKPGKLSGTWYRDLDGVVISATFSGDELKLCMTQKAEGMIAHMTLTANYAVTREGLVHGVITGADGDVKSTSQENSARATTAMTDGIVEMQKLVDCPFSFRVKSTSIGVMVSNLRMAVEGMSSKETAILCGMFRHSADGRVPTARGVLKTYTTLEPCNGSDPGTAPVPVYGGPPPYMPPMPTPTPVVPAGHAVPGAPMHAVPMMVPPSCPGGTSSSITNPRLAEVQGTKTPQSGRYLQHYPEYFPPDPQHPLPRELAAQAAHEEATRQVLELTKPLPVVGMTGSGCYGQVLPLPSYSPTRPANVPAGEFEMMADTFASMLRTKPVSLCDAGSQCAEMARPMTHSVCQTEMNHSTAGPLTPPAPPTRTTIGTWVREVGPIVYVVKIDSDRLSVSATTAEESLKGPIITTGLILTADYHLSRDGSAAVGLITSVDLHILNGEALCDPSLRGMSDELNYFQKTMADQPIALSLRMHGDELVIGNVRIPDVNPAHGMWSPMTVIAGRYANAGNNPLPKPKVVKWYSTVSVPMPFTRSVQTTSAPAYIPVPTAIPAYATGSTGGIVPAVPPVTSVPQHSAKQGNTVPTPIPAKGTVGPQPVQSTGPSRP
jgi:hypothetical protein